MMKKRPRRTLAVSGAALALAAARVSFATDVSPPVILQYFESDWKTMEKRLPDVFMAGYGAIWTPPPGRALYDDQGGGIGYNMYDRFDLGKAGDTTLYGTETGYRDLVKAVHQMNGDVYVDFVHHHVGSWDVPGYTGANGFTPDPGAQVQSTSDYPGFQLSDPYVGSNSFDPNYRNYAGQRDTYPDPPVDSNGNDPQYLYQYRLAHLITIDLTSTRAFVRNPVPGNAQDIPQAPSAWAIGTSTLLPGNHPGASTILRQANTPTTDNARLYPDQSLPGMTLTDPANGNQTVTIYPFNPNNTSGTPVAETPAGYMERYAQWLVNSVGVDGLRIDAARHVPFGVTNDPYNPDDVNIPALIDRAVYRESTRTNLDGTQRQVFSFQEVFTGDKGYNQQFVRKDINPATPNVIGGNRDVLDFPGWFAMRNNFTGDGTHNNWYNVRYSSQDSQDDGLANNGSEGIRFVINHDDGKGDINNQNNDYIVLDNVAHAWTLFQPGNAYVYFNSHEFDRTGNTTFFLKDGRGDALGGQYGTIITNMLDIRNSYGRGNFQERWIDPGGSSAVYAFERTGSMLVGLNIGYNPGAATRTMATSFTPGQHLVELTGNWQDPSGTVAHTVTVGAGGTVTINIPWNNANNGNKGYVVYGLPRPQGTISLTNVSQTLAPDNTGNNATDRLTAIDVITNNSFNVNLNTTAVTLTDGYRDKSADGDQGYLKIDGGLDLNNNGHVDFTSQSDTRYGFENFSTANSPGYNNANGDGIYAQSIDATQLSEGYHYITGRVYRQRSDGGPDIYTDFKKVIYVDRLPPSSQIAGLTQTQVGNTKNVNVQTRSLDLTADNVQVFMDLGFALTDAQVLAMVNSNSASTQTDRDLFSKDFSNVTSGTHVLSIVTREITGNYSIIRATGYQVSGGTGLGFGDLDANGDVNSSDISQFQTVLQSNNTQFNAGAEANTDGQIDLADTFLLGPRLSQLNVDSSTQTAYQNLIHSPYVTSGTYTVNANHSVFDVTAGTTHVTSGNSLTARSIRGNSLVIDSGAVTTIQPASLSGSTSVLSSLSITGTGQLDLNDNALILNYSASDTTHSTRDTIRNLLINGRNGAPGQPGAWNGLGGIVSTFAHANGNGFNLAIGYADNEDLAAVRGSGSYTSFAGQTVTSNTVLVQLTRGADATLDGVVDAQDVTVLGARFMKPNSGQWCFGDFDYSGTCDATDVTTLGSTFGKTSPALSPAQMTAEFGAAFTGAFEAGQNGAVPEPSAFSPLALGAAGLMARRNRQRKARAI